MNNSTNNLKFHHRFSDCIYWNLVAAVPVVTATIALYKNSPVLLIAYLVLLVVSVAVIMKFFCSHCPHYVRGEKSIKCMFFWGIPKFFRDIPGPMSALEKIITSVTSMVMILMPVYWLVKLPEFLLIYVLAMTVLVMTVRRYECSRCIYVDCFLNSVSNPGQEVTLKREE
jgi:hypothetical protein